MQVFDLYFSKNESKIEMISNQQNVQAKKMNKFEEDQDSASMDKIS